MAERVLIGSSEGLNMVSSWTDELYCTKRADGTFSLRARKTGMDGNHWFAGVTRIRTAEKFVEAYRSIDEIDIDDIDLESDALPEIEKLDPLFAEQIRNALYKELLDDEAYEFIATKVTDLLSQSKIDLPSSTTNARVHYERVWRYAFDQIEATGTIPNGSIEIDGRKVIFPS